MGIWHSKSKKFQLLFVAPLSRGASNAFGQRSPRCAATTALQDGQIVAILPPLGLCPRGRRGSQFGAKQRWQDKKQTKVSQQGEDPNVESAATTSGDAGLLDRARIIAKPGFNRWLVPPAALAIHLCIGMSYGLSVFWRPLERALGISQPQSCPDMTTLQALFTTTCDWTRADLVPIFTIGIVFLGLSAAVFGGWLERAGPRKAGVAAALCWGGGFIVSALGVYIHQLWLLWLGLGVLGGIGLGLGYISPVSTLIKWFPDRRGMATGMAIMGFGGGAMIGSLLANELMKYFSSATSVGVAQSMAVIGLLYILFMLGGAFGYRIAPDGWKPDGWTPPADTKAMITTGHVHLDNAHKTPQFWLIWIVLCMNVSAGIGVLATASPMLQEIFAGQLIGLPDLTLKELRCKSGGHGCWCCGRVRRTAFTIQQLRADYLGFAVRLYWPQKYVLLLLPDRHFALRIGANPCQGRVAAAVRCGLLFYPNNVWRRVCNGARVSSRYLWDPVCWCDPWPIVNRMVDGRCARPVSHRLHS